MEDIRTNEALVVHGLNMCRQNAEAQTNPPFMGIDMALPGAERTVVMLRRLPMPSFDRWAFAERARRQAVARRRSLRFWFWVLLIGAFCLAFSIDHFTSLTTVTPAHAEEVMPPVPPVSTEFAIVTAYTSSVDETDDSPFITASGAHTQPGTLACPAQYAFGTQVRIGDATYTCRDRMNVKYGNRFDVWVQTKAEAKARGIQKLPIQIL